MIKLLIVDDEPLVQIGIKSMLDWKKYDIEVCGTASNGQQALELIHKHRPHIVITDIKMPVLDGLELVRICTEEEEYTPAFIILTSFEDFEFAKRAIKYQVVDYLIKLELDQDSLEASIQSALKTIQETELLNNNTSESVAAPHINIFYDKFFIKLLHNLFDSDAQLQRHLSELQIDFKSDKYAVCFCEISSFKKLPPSTEQTLNQYMCTIAMFEEIFTKYLKAFTVILDQKRFAIICCLDNLDATSLSMSIDHALQKTCDMVEKYFNVNLVIGIGSQYNQINEIFLSYQEAKQAFIYANVNQNIYCYSNLQNIPTAKNVFNLSIFKDELIHSFEEYNTDTLTSIFDQIIQLFEEYNPKYLQAIDATCNILYLSLNLLPDSEKVLEQIFSDEVEGYRSIYNQKSIPQVIAWLKKLEHGLCTYFDTYRNTHKNHIVTQVQKYLNAHLKEKLTLNDVANIFSISPNYLSSIFKKYCEYGFSEYINQIKIKRAKQLLSEGNYKIYEVSDQLGFENSYYFSKVFKKIVGCSPKEYLQKP